MVRLSPRLTDESLQRVYEDWYSSGYIGTQAAQEGDKSRYREFERGHLARISKVVSPPGALLDVGTGSGLFLQVANRQGWRAIGLDFSSQAAELALTHHDVEVRVGRLSDLPADEQYDIITMFDYLEHTTRPAEDLQEAIRRLKPGGHLVVRVPNLGGWQARFMGPKWVGIISLHLSYFEAKTLADLVSKQGLVIVYSDMGNYQTLAELLGNKFAWIFRRATSSRTELGVGSDRAESQRSSKLRRALRFALASLHELIDHAGGWFGQSNYIFVVAKKPS
ncbi:2-polyprenyl-3-methyl-5-hydroxy-6-metoxy-1,4-benzoquinol methylase [Bradyrhizobium sp. CIR3A]|nr:2-polyprenyl-3-methyl-5-hydroxy-6-metoxy-1,4-benzoquinol methylase [Bradyrhizobium sp. CIR3A]